MKKFFLLTYLVNIVFCSTTQTIENKSQVELPEGYKTEVLISPKVVQGTTFSKGSTLVFDKDGFLRTATLGEDQTIMDVNYKKNFPHVFKAGTILQYKEPKNSFGEIVKFLDVPKSITIIKPVEIYGLSFGSGTTIFFPTEGKKPFLGLAIERTREDLILKGKKVPAGSTLLFEDKDKYKVLNKGEWEAL